MRNRTTLILVLALLCAARIQAADPTFVGLLSLASEEEVADELEISADAREKLQTLIDDREDAALELALSLKDFPEPERREKLAPFVAESERLGFELLTETQQARLRQIAIARQGLASLGDAEIAKQAELTAEQQLQLGELLAERTRELAKGGAEDRRLTEAAYERKLAALLTTKQRTAWEKAAGLLAADSQPATQPTPDAEPTTTAAATHGADLAGEPTPETPAAGDLRLRFNFRFAPWKEVLDWFASQADLSLVLDAPPPGTFNYADSRQYSPSEAIDLLNSVLLTKGYTLLRRDRLLMVINLEDGIPPNLVAQVSPEELDGLGEYELVSCLFSLGKTEPKEIEEEIRKLLGPQGSLVVLGKTRQIYVTETAGKLRTIRRILEAGDQPITVVGSRLEVFQLEHVTADEVLVVIRQLLGLPEAQNATADGSMRIAVDPIGARMLITAKPEDLERITEILKILDIDDDRDNLGTGIAESPQLEVYPITDANPDSVLQVLQTVMAGAPDVRLTVDPITGNLVAMARPRDHATIRATIEQMQKDARQVEVIRLAVVDPQAAVLAINKLFGAIGEEAPPASAPRVDADPIARQLLIRGSAAQISQIRSLLEKMGESALDEDYIADAAERGNVRMVPLTGFAARSVLEQMETIWPTTRPNKIRIVTPSAVIRTVHPRADDELDQMLDQFTPDKIRQNLQPRDEAPKATPPKASPPREDTAPSDNELGASSAAEHFVSRTSFPLEELACQEETDVDSAPVKTNNDDAPAKPNEPPAEIVVAPGPGGIMIASQDLDALDAFEELLLTLGEQAQAAGPQFTVFYLKYAKADRAAELLQEILGGGSGDAAGGGGSLLGDLAGAALGDSGGLLGSLLGMGGGGGGGAFVSAGAVSISADNRLNALVAQGAAEDLDTVEQLLQVIDQQASPENVQTIPPPRLIPVYYSDANEIAGVVRQVYAERVRGSNNSQQRQPSPEDLIRALRGSRGGGQQQSREQEQQQMSVGTDPRSNSLIVSAPDALFSEVQALVRQLDQAGTESNQAVEVVSIRRASPELVQKALSSIVGAQVHTSTSSVSGQTSSAARPTTDGKPAESQNATAPSDQMREQIQQRIEFFNALQRAGQQGDQSGGRGGFGRGGDDGGGRRGGGR